MTFLARLLSRLRPAPPAPVAPPPPAWPSEADLARILAELEAAAPAAWAPILLPELRKRGIITPARLSAFLANVLHETGGLRRLTENLTYNPARLMQVWPTRFPTLDTTAGFAANPEALANAVYGGRMGNAEPGDGWRFRGRGLIQITGRANYAAAAREFGRPLDDAFLDWCASPEGAAATACWWWAAHGCNGLADAGDWEGLRRRVNGKLIGFAEVEKRRRKAAEALA